VRSDILGSGTAAGYRRRGNERRGRTVPSKIEGNDGACTDVATPMDKHSNRDSLFAWIGFGAFVFALSLAGCAARSATSPPTTGAARSAPASTLPPPGNEFIFYRGEP
jgi:hypothetical protein